MTFKETVKQWFVTGAFPTQAQFWWKFDSLRWKDEAIGIADVTDLQAILNSFGSGAEVFTVGGGWDNTYSVAVGFVLEKIIVVPVSDCSPYCGFVGGSAGDIIPIDATNIVTVSGTVWSVNIFDAAAVKVIEVSDVPNTSKVYFVKRKIY